VDLNRKIDMSEKELLENPKGTIFRLEKKAGNRAASQLADEELERVVGGYIGETEKNRS
jgi:hypothetical protein